MEASLGVAARFRRMEAGLEEALADLRVKNYAGAEETISGLLSMDQEDDNGL